MIPARLHAVWLGGEVPEVLGRFLDSWRRHHPAWEFTLWTSIDELELRNRRFVERPQMWVPERNVGQFVSDVMRYEILERFGGVYVDCDMECRRPIDELLGGVECFAAWEKQDVWIGNAILGAAPGALFLQRTIEALPFSIERHQGKRPNVSSGPQFLTSQYAGHHDELTVFPQAWFYPAAWNELELVEEEHPDAWTVHHWWNQQKLRGGKLSPNSRD